MLWVNAIEGGVEFPVRLDSAGLVTAEGIDRARETGVRCEGWIYYGRTLEDPDAVRTPYQIRPERSAAAMDQANRKLARDLRMWLALKPFSATRSRIAEVRHSPWRADRA